MRPNPKERLAFIIGISTSLFAHVFLAAIAILILESNAARAREAGEVFSVTIEGGMNLGSISQVPKEGAKKILTPDANADEKQDPKTPPEEKQEKVEKETAPTEPEDEPEKKIEAPSAIEEKERKEKEKKEKQEKEKKIKEEKQKEEKKKKEEEKKAADEAKKKEEEQKKKERAARDKALAQRLQALKNRYEGESADAGGKGFGAASIGGKGMGGGTLASAQKIAYYNALKDHVKSGWTWLNSADRLIAKVQVSILQDGRVQNVNIIQKSGNGNFDDSVVRAVFKASPVPPAPTNLYEEFKDVVFTFDSAE